MTLAILTYPLFRAFDANGDPLAGGLLYSYASGTATPLALLAADGVTPLSNPVVLDSAGKAEIRLGPNAYTLNLTSALGVQQSGFPISNVTNPQTPAGIDDYSATATQMRLATDPGELERLRFAQLEAKQRVQPTLTYWYETPSLVTGWGLAHADLYGSKAAGSATIQAAHDALPAAGGVIVLSPGTYTCASQITFTKPVRVQTAGRDTTILNASAQGYPLLYTTASLAVQGLTLTRTEAPVATSHAAIRLHSAAAAGTRILVEDCTITGFDIGVYTAEGTLGYLESVVVRDCSIITNSLNTNVNLVIPTLNLNNAKVCEIRGCTLSCPVLGQANNVYCIGCNVLTIEGNIISQDVAIKILSNPTHPVYQATVRHNYIASASLGILTQTDEQPIYTLDISGNTFDSGRVLDATTAEITITNVVSTAPSPVDYRLIPLTGNTFLSTDKKCIFFTLGAGHTISTVVMHGNAYFNWSAGSAGTYYALQKGGSGTYGNLLVDNEVAVGNSNGKGWWNLGFSNESLGTIFETGTTNPTVLPANAVRYLHRLRVTHGIAASSGFQHQRTTTGSVAAGTRADVVVTWGSAFADANYTVAATMFDGNGAGLGLRVERIRARSATTVTVQVINDAVGDVTGSLDLIGMHD